MDAGEFERLAVALRPRLHRYCARMSGSVIDGEDVVQEALLKAFAAKAEAASIAMPEAWLFRIAHNAALDHLRRRNRRSELMVDDDIATVPDAEAPDPDIAASSLRAFMRLPAVQRSSVILMDVLGYGLRDITQIIGASLPAVKASLHRGRARLRRIAGESDDEMAPPLTGAERTRLAVYVARFNARDFDAVRDMLAEDVRLELVATTRRRGKSEVATYFSNYALVHDWVLAPGLVDGRAAIVVFRPGDPARAPYYFIVLEFDGEHVAAIRDFRHARYVIEGAAVRCDPDPI